MKCWLYLDYPVSTARISPNSEGNFKNLFPIKFNSHQESKNSDDGFAFQVSLQVRSGNLLFSLLCKQLWTQNSPCFPSWYVCKHWADPSGQNRTEIMKRGALVLETKSKMDTSRRKFALMCSIWQWSPVHIFLRRNSSDSQAGKHSTCSGMRWLKL